jgi:hypothetical protein
MLSGEVVFTSHALKEMGQDGISQAERGSWRYRVRAHGPYVVAAFRSEVAAVVVTAWRAAR